MDDETQIKYTLKRPTRGPALITFTSRSHTKALYAFEYIIYISTAFWKAQFCLPSSPLAAYAHNWAVSISDPYIGILERLEST
jgi:hypothetical protein